MTSFDTGKSVRDEAIRIARETAAADTAGDRAHEAGMGALLVGQRRGPGRSRISAVVVSHELFPPLFRETRRGARRAVGRATRRHSALARRLSSQLQCVAAVLDSLRAQSSRACGSVGALPERDAAPDALACQKHLSLRRGKYRHFLLCLRAGPGEVQERQPSPDRDAAVRLHPRHGRHVHADSLVLPPLPAGPEVSRGNVYPVLREAALFYCSFAEKCPRDVQGKAKFGPSYSPEHGGFGIADCPFDLAYARSHSRPPSPRLANWGATRPFGRFRKALDLLPGYPTAPDASGRPVVVDWTGCKFNEIPMHNITVPAVPVFPADQVTWFSPEPEKELFRNTIRQTIHRGFNATVMFSVAKARLSCPTPATTRGSITSR